MTTAIVTGAAGGIGLEVCRQLAQRHLAVVLTARDPARAEAAAASLRDEGLDVVGHQLDVCDQSSVDLFVLWLAGRPVQALVNNAAAFVDWSEATSRADLDAARRVMDTNLFGAWRVTMAVLPLLRDSGHGRIVNVTSSGGSHADAIVGLGALCGRGAAYGVSKAAQNAWTAALAAELAGTGVLVNAANPGLTATRPGAEEMGARPVADGAAGIVWAATLPDDGPTGGFFKDGEPVPV